MLNEAIPGGAIFYGEPRRRIDVPFTPELRARTEALAHQMHLLYNSRTTPAAVPGSYCRTQHIEAKSKTAGVRPSFERCGRRSSACASC